MPLLDDLMTRADSKCELCGDTEALEATDVGPTSDGSIDQSILLCVTCRTPGDADEHHWRCLSDSMWTPIPAVQVMAWRQLHALNEYAWARELLDMLYLDDETLEWAKAGTEPSETQQIRHFDSNGAQLNAGDTVVLIKDLNVKGAGFTAKRGTAVRNISLDQYNEKHIEGRVEGQHIVILTEFVKKK